MSTTTTTLKFKLEPADRDRLACLCGPLDDNLRQLERRLGVQIVGPEKRAHAVKKILFRLYTETAPLRGGRIPDISPEDVHLAITEAHILESADAPEELSEVGAEINRMGEKASNIKTKRGLVRARSDNQAAYIQNIVTHDVTFGIGPAGTGKTYLAVAAAVDALERQEIRRILLTRPAVEAGEKLGFLPGDLSQKVDPYLRPLYDALFEMLGFERVEKLIERQVIEIAPLAYMRGRTLNDSFIILDESQNTTTEQMKMFLTRIGFNSKAVITGDITQIDLPRNVKSGLKQVIEVLANVPEISFNFFTSSDVVRHPVVARIVQAYEKFDQDEKARVDKRRAELKENQEAKASSEAKVSPEHKTPNANVEAHENFGS